MYQRKIVDGTNWSEHNSYGIKDRGELKLYPTFSDEMSEAKGRKEPFPDS